MHFTIGTFAARLRALIAQGNGPVYWAAVWENIESQETYATGDNYCFEIRSIDELATPQAKIYAFPINFKEQWDAVDFAQSALEGMCGNLSLAEFSGTLKAVRIEIVKSRMFCVSHHIYWQATEAPGSDYIRDVDEWLSEIGSDRLSYADDECYAALREPRGCVPKGRARWLHDWLQFRYDTWSTPVTVTPRVIGSEYDTDLPSEQVDRAIVLAAAAFTWNDYAMVYNEDAARAADLFAAAGLALFLASQTARDDDEDVGDLASWGRAGGLERHKGTRDLKEWALGEASRMQGNDRSIARSLSNRIPEKYLDVSEDPARLIYDAIRANRAAQKDRTRS